MDKRKNNDVSHEGHRERLTKLIEASGIENVSKVQAVEYFLTYIIPRGDVNPLAHRLLDKFDNFGNIIDASEGDLKSVKGINERSAKKIKLFNELIWYYSFSRMAKKISMDKKEEFLDMLEELLRFKKSENLLILAFNHKFYLTHKRKFTDSDLKQVGVSPFQLYDFISTAKPAYISIAHNHPGGTARPSQDDLDAMTFIENLIKNFKCKLFDSYIIGEDGLYSTRQSCFLRNFDSTGQLMSDVIKFDN